MHKPLCSVSLDLDNLWSYLKTHGDAGWDEYPSYLDIVVPRVLGFLKGRGHRITWFIVGKDAAEPKHHPVLRSLVTAGHEVANHSFHHEPWLHLYSEAEIDAELAKTEDAIEQATGARPKVFQKLQGQGQSVNSAVRSLQPVSLGIHPRHDLPVKGLLQHVLQQSRHRC